MVFVSKKSRASFDRLNNARAEKVEIENSKTRREIVPISEVEAEWRRLVVQFKARFSALPAHLARRLVHVDDPNDISDIVSDEVNKIFEILAADGASLMQSMEEEEETREELEKEAEKNAAASAPSKDKGGEGDELKESDTKSEKRQKKKKSSRLPVLKKEKEEKSESVDPPKAAPPSPKGGGVADILDGLKKYGIKR